MEPTPRHRGAHPQDAQLFSPATVPTLRAAVAELSWLLTRDYPPAASLKLVGDHHQLKDRQRNAIRHSACSDHDLASRLSRRQPFSSIRSTHSSATPTIIIDGLNLLITLEAAMGGGIIVRGRDTALRDLSSVHGTYRRVHETEAAARLVGEILDAAGVASILWLLDQPVSNSGRLRTLLLELAALHNWPWTVELDMNPDHRLRRATPANTLIVTSDSAILDAPIPWLNHASDIIATHLPHTTIHDLSAVS